MKVSMSSSTQKYTEVQIRSYANLTVCAGTEAAAIYTYTQLLTNSF